MATKRRKKKRHDFHYTPLPWWRQYDYMNAWTGIAIALAIAAVMIVSGLLIAEAVQH